jgi:tRNA threonylcarbamoyladenosine biosynthesis protein TsaE
VEGKVDLLVDCNVLMTFTSNSTDETKAIGYRLGKLLRPGSVVGLYGELGSGKTVFVKGIARAFGIHERDIMSASFTIITQYNTVPQFNHIDLYRIEKESELEEIGLWDYIGNGSVSVIEWAEKVEQELPDDTITVRLRPIEDNIREIIIEGDNEEYWNNL